MLHKANQPPPLLAPAEKPLTGTVPITLPAVTIPTPVPAPSRSEFPSAAPASMVTAQTPVFSGNTKYHSYPL